MSNQEMVIATADICPHGGSSSLCEWCGYKTQVAHLLARIAALEAEVSQLKSYKIRCDALERVVEAAKEMMRKDNEIPVVAFENIRAALAELEHQHT